MQKKMIDKKSQGKKNREAGRNFEKKIRADLEKKGWNVDRWTNQVEFPNTFSPSIDKQLRLDFKSLGKLVPCKPKFNPFTHSLMMNRAGFPDFIIFRKAGLCDDNRYTYEVIGVECKGGNKDNKYLSGEEQEKCRWLLNNNIFSKILIAQKGLKRGEIIFKEFENGN